MLSNTSKIEIQSLLDGRDQQKIMKNVKQIEIRQKVVKSEKNRQIAEKSKIVKNLKFAKVSNEKKKFKTLQYTFKIL